MAPCRLPVPGARGTQRAPGDISSSAYDRDASGRQVRRQFNTKLSSDKRLAARIAVKEEAIVIDSGSNSDSSESDAGDGSDGNDGPIIGSRTGAASPPLAPTSVGSSLRPVEPGRRACRVSTVGAPTLQRQFSRWDHVDLKTSTEKTASNAPISGLLLNSIDTTSTSVSSKLPNVTYTTKKEMSLAHGESLSSKNRSITSHHLSDTPSALALSSSSGNTHVPKALCGKSSDVEESNKDVKPGISYQKRATATVNTNSTNANRDSTLSRNSSSLPHMFPPAVKTRVYSTTRPATRRNVNDGSKKLEAFGFVSAATLVSRTNTATTKSATTITPTSALESNATSHSITKLKSQNASKHMKLTQEQSRSRQLSSRTAQNISAPLTPVPIVEAKPISKPTQRGTLKVQTSNIQPPPRTPENRITVKQEPALSSSIGTYGDPYTISSGSDSDSDDDSSVIPCSPRPVKSLSSFATKLEVYETASDVEAVLNQFPVWLESPSPTELGSSYSSMPTPVQPIISNRLSKASRDDAGINKRKEGREKRRIRFSPSPSPTKRTALLDQSSRSPAAGRYIASSPVGRITAPSEKMNKLDVDPNSRKQMNPNPNQDLPLNHEESTSTKVKKRGNWSKNTKIEKKKKKKKKKKVRPSGNKAACRHRNRHRKVRQSGQISTV
ncbi:hypothetical protein F5Y09DRAFT_241340 [Xylaria sp. FL1042]|nr:hypothetical protein F5Y09DRAFT_241340 [Xylaria sp. FL1042]